MVALRVVGSGVICCGVAALPTGRERVPEGLLDNGQRQALVEFVADTVTDVEPPARGLGQAGGQQCALPDPGFPLHKDDAAPPVREILHDGREQRHVVLAPHQSLRNAGMHI